MKSRIGYQRCLRISLLFFLLVSWTPTVGEELELVLQAGHAQTVTDAVWIDDEHFVSGSADGSLKVWNTRNQRVIRTLPPPRSVQDAGGPHGINDLGLTKDGLWVAYYNGVLGLWDLTSGTLKTSVRLPDSSSGPDLQIATNLDGDLLVYGNQDGFSQITATGAVEHVTRDKKTIKVLTLSEDGKTLALVDSEGVWVGSPASLKQLPVSFVTRWGVDSLVFSEDGSKLYLGTSTNWIEGWDLNQQKLIFRRAATESAPSEPTLKGQGYSGENLGLLLQNYDADTLLLATATGELFLVAKNDGQTLPLGNLNVYGVRSVEVNPRQNGIIVGLKQGGKGEIPALLKEQNSWTKSSFGGRAQSYSRLAVADKKLFMTSHSDTVASYDLLTGQPHILFKTGYFPQMAIAGDRLYCGGNDGKVYAYAVGSGALLWEASLSRRGARYGDGIQSLALSSDGRYLAAGVLDLKSKVVLLNPLDGTEIANLPTQNSASCLLFSPDSSQLFIGRHNEIELYDLNYKKVVHSWASAIERLDRIVSLVNHPSTNQVVALTNRGKLLSIDRLRLDEKPLVRSVSGIKEAKSLRVDGTEFLIGAEHSAYRVGLDGQNPRQIGLHVAPVTDALVWESRVVTTGWDSKIGFWDHQSGQEVATLFCLDGGTEWLVLTPDYHFDGSTKAQSLIEWRWNNELFAVSRFFEKFYQPGLLARSFSSNPITHRVAPRASLGEQPPKVTIETPKKLGDGTYRIDLSVEGDSSRRDDVRLYHNGHRVAGSPPFFIKPVAGKNSLRASAFNQEKTVESTPHHVSFESSQPEVVATLHILAVGVNDYPNPLDFAVEDAKSFVAAFEPGLYDKVNKVTLLDKNASKANIQKALAGIPCEPQDTLLVFLAGHGTILEDKFHFLPFGSDGMVAEDALSSQEIGAGLAALSATRQVLFLDTCHAGASANDLAALLTEKKVPLIASTKGAQIIREQQIMARQAGTFLVAGSSPNATAAEIPELGHGLFTYAVLNGLKGDPSSAQQDVTVNELLRYLNRAVPELSQKFRGNAQGIWQFSAGQDFPIARPK